MAKSQISEVIFSALLICFLLIASNEVQIVEAKVCSRMSRTWSGMCLNTGNCDRQCRNWERAQNGACHRRGWGFACFCYHKC
ncbi:defensin-like protein 1 [Olea europaea var. sylvestris]|uniref:defensin-like protein 1 n=1 Tax=Olea europaea var. sylvestris TaxID=158386 RepID=UPI000C1D713E|nr:defensin-like protein 1 [Olea europaea var. sylvestris]